MSVGVLAPDLSEGYFTRVMSGVVEQLTAAHYFYFTACHDWNPELIEKYPRMLVERAVDGFLLLNTPADKIDVPVPVVAISAHSAVKNVTNIVLDHATAVEQALAHLVALGHRRIAFMRGPHAIPDSEIRWKAIQKVPGPCVSPSTRPGHPHRCRRLVHEAQLPPHGPGDRLQAHAGASRTNP